MMNTTKRIIFISGPTASGKTAFAVKVAKELKGVVINADSLQLFEDLPLLTARPTLKEQEDVPHYLYGFLKADAQPTAMFWTNNVKKMLEKLPESQKIIIVGGTGLYMGVFLNGLAPIPFISDETNSKVKEMAFDLKDNFYDFVVKKDPAIKDLYHKNDIKRLSRALAVFLETKKSISHFLKLPHIDAHKDICYPIYLKPERKILHERIEQRFHLMLEYGVIDEMKSFIKNYNVDSKLPVLHAVGAREIINFINGNLTYNQMIELCVLKTKQYAKRQYTWFNQQIDHEETIEFPD